jgi:mRNA interferase MazF
LRAEFEAETRVSGFDEVIAADDDDFAGSGLKVVSLIRLGMVATIPQSVILGELGQVSQARPRCRGCYC